MIPNLFKWFIDSMKAIYNSRILPEEEIELQIRNRAFCYGDGLFETIVTGPDRINLLPYNMARLVKACGILDMEMPFEQQALNQHIESLKSANGLTGQTRCRVQLWRDEGGLYEPDQNQCSYLITVSESSRPFYSKVKRLSVAQQARLSYHPLSFAKTMSAMPYVLAGVERRKSIYDELIITDSAGHIAECVASNIFWVKDDTVFTPSLDSGCVDGTMRQFIMARFKSADLQVHEVMEPVASLTEADCVFISNAAGIQWVEHFEDKTDFTDPKPLLERAAILPPQP